MFIILVCVLWKQHFKKSSLPPPATKLSSGRLIAPFCEDIRYWYVVPGVKPVKRATLPGANPDLDSTVSPRNTKIIVHDSTLGREPGSGMRMEAEAARKVEIHRARQVLP